VVASKSGGGLSIQVNAKLFETFLTDKDSVYVVNDIQDIEINSTIISESYV
jgi:hypothetical protein